MNFGLFKSRRLARAVSRSTLSLLLLSSAASAFANGYNESVSGDLSSVATSPTKIGALTPGVNVITGSTIPSGAIIDPVTGARAVEDNDYLTFTIPTGYVLSQLIVDRSSVFQPGDRMFFGIAQGDQVVVDPSFTSAAGLLGWTLIGSPDLGTNVLPALGLAAPANFPAIGGATRFSGPLGAGDYTLWMLDGDQPAAYSFDLVVTAVPEAASWATMLCGLGAVGAALRRRPGRRVPATA